MNGTNLFSMETSTPGYLANDSSGNIAAQDVRNMEITSDYIPVSEGDTFIIQTWINSTDSVSDYGDMIYYMWFSDKTPNLHIGLRNDYHKKCYGFAHDIIVTNPAPENAKYIRVSARLYKGGIMKIERGNILIQNSLENQK